jgi:hypothetical protein
LGSGANQLAVFFFQFGFQIFPIVTAFFVIIFFSDCPDNIQNAEIPLVVFLIPSGAHFFIVKKSD